MSVLNSDRDVALLAVRRIDELLATEARRWGDFRERVLDQLNPVPSFTNCSTFSYPAAVGNGSFLVLNQNSNRKGFLLFNDAQGGAGDLCYIRLGAYPATAADASFSLPVGGSFSSRERLPGYQGHVWALFVTGVSSRLFVSDFS